MVRPPTPAAMKAARALNAVHAMRASASTAVLQSDEDPIVPPPADPQPPVLTACENTDSNKIAALQRNFETLSKVAADERLELQRLRKAEKAWQETAEMVKSDALRDLEAKQRALEDLAVRAEADLQAANRRAADERGRLDAKVATAEQRFEREKVRAAAAESRAAEAERRAKRSEEAVVASASELEERLQKATEAVRLAAQRERTLQDALKQAHAEAASQALQTEELKASAAEHAAALKAELAAAHIRAEAAEGAAETARSTAERAGTLAAKEIGELRTRLRRFEQAAAAAADAASSATAEQQDLARRLRAEQDEAARKSLELQRAAEAQALALEASMQAQLQAASAAAADEQRRLDEAKGAALCQAEALASQVDSLVAQLHEAQARWSAAESASAALQLRVQAEQEAHRETTARLEAMVTKVQSETAAEATAAAAARAQLEHASVSYGAASEKHARAISSMQAKLDAAAAELRDMSASLVNSEKRAREQQAAEKERSAAERHQLMADLAERVRLVGQREAGMNSALAKVMAAEEAMEACITCMACMEVLHEPTTCTPCGHTYCAACLKAQEGGGGDYKLAVCPECDGPAGKVVSVGLLGMLTAKFCYQKQTLAELKAGAAATAAVSKFAGLVQKVVP